MTSTVHLSFFRHDDPERDISIRLRSRFILLAARDDQEVALVATSPTDALARVNQEVLLVGTSPTTTLARVNQEILLVAIKITHNNLPIQFKRFARRRIATLYRRRIIKWKAAPAPSSDQFPNVFVCT